MNQTLEKLPSLLLIGNLESHLAQHELPEKGDVLFDLSDACYVEAASLILILALITKLQREGRQLLLNLPHDKKVRDFLRSWRFPDAVFAQTGRHFRSFTTKESHKYFGENPTQRTNAPFAKHRLDSAGKQLVEVNEGYYIPFQVYAREEHPFNDSLALAECASWCGPFIWEVLTKLLNKDPDQLARHIVFEALVNAVRHPNASRIVGVSQIGRRIAKNDVATDTSNEDLSTGRSAKKTSPSHFTMIWWDDGESIIDTLRKPLSKGMPIRSVAIAKKRVFDVKISSFDGETIDKIRVETDMDLRGDTQEELLLLSSVFPGVTRDPLAEAAVAPASISTTPESSYSGGQPGMGLYLLVNAAVDLYGGEVSFRSKNYFMNIKGSTVRIKGSMTRGKGPYKVKIKKLLSSQAIPGNMVTVRMPLVHI